MNYILRVVIHEDAWQRQTDQILELCARTPIREVMLMEQSHQILTCPFPLEKHRRMAQIYRQMADAFSRAGITFSINLATLVGHNDAPAPRRLRLPFTRFVGSSLTEAESVYCISDPEWVDYAAQVCGIYAQTHPVRMMIDDDFRSLNHSDPVGCFCENHVRLTGEELGFPITAGQIRGACLGQGDPRIKQAWMQVNFRAQLRAAHAMEQAIHAVSPQTQVGLMNSGEPAHSLQGREMSELLQTFAGSGRQCLSRPLGGAYSDGLHQELVRMVTGMSLSMAAVGQDTYWVSEVENYPHSLYTKSAAMTELQMCLHALAGADALSLNLYDYLATPMPLQPEYAQLVNHVHPLTQAIAEVRRGTVMTGVGLPWFADSAAHTVNRSHTVGGMLPDRSIDSILPLLGIPVQFRKAKTNFLLADQVLSCSRQEIEEFLRGGLVVDNIAAGHLYRMGYGDLLGCTPDGSIEEPCTEQLSNPRYAGQWPDTLMCVDWALTRRQGAWISHLTADPAAEEITRLLDEEKRYLGAGMLRFRNRLGGDICVMAYPVTELGWLSRGRGELMRRLLSDLPGGSGLPFVGGDMNLAPFYYRSAQGWGLLGIVNCGLDPARAQLPEGIGCEYLSHPGDPEPLTIPPVSLKLYRITKEES